MVISYFSVQNYCLHVKSFVVVLVVVVCPLSCGLHFVVVVVFSVIQPREASNVFPVLG